jgi:hypothetical protein
MPKNKARKAKPGPRPHQPADAERDLITLAIAIGMTRDAIADAIGMPLRSLARTYAHELKVGRSQRLLANAARLDRAADQGNVAAMKALQVMMGDRPGTEAVSKWDGFAERYHAEQANLARKPDFQEPPWEQ